MHRLSVAEARCPENVGREAVLQGWVRTRRDSKAGFSFLELNDGSCFGNIQVIAEAGLDNYQSEIRKLSVRRRWGDDSADSYDLKIDTSRGKINYKMNYFNKRYRPILSDIIPAKTEFKI